MAIFAPILAAISLFIWITLTFFRGAFWQLRAFDDDLMPHTALPEWPRVVAVVPARNEAGTIEQIGERIASVARERMGATVETASS